MPFCRKCGSVLADDAAFCESCGTAIAPSGAPTLCSSGAEQKSVSVDAENQPQVVMPMQTEVPEKKKGRVRAIVIVCIALVVVAAVAIVAAIYFSTQPATEWGDSKPTVSSEEGSNSGIPGEEEHGDQENAQSLSNPVIGEWEIIAGTTEGSEGIEYARAGAGKAIFEKSGDATLTLGSETFRGSWVETSSRSDEGYPYVKIVLENGVTWTALYVESEDFDGGVVLATLDGTDGESGLVMQRVK